MKPANSDRNAAYSQQNGMLVLFSKYSISDFYQLKTMFAPCQDSLVSLTVHFAPCVRLYSKNLSTRVWELLFSKYPNLMHRQQAREGGFVVDSTKGSPFNQWASISKTLDGECGLLVV